METEKISLFLNIPFDLEFNGKTYSVKAANITDAILYQKKLQELADSKNPAVDIELAVYCLYLALRKTDPEITEDYIKENCPANMDTFAIIEKLGFMSPQKRARMLIQKMGIENKDQ